MGHLRYFLLFFILNLFQLHAQDARLEKILKKFDTYAEESRIAWKVYGMSIGIIQGDKIIFAKGYGQRGINDIRPVDENTIFQIGSLSKAFTSALVAISVDKGWLKWEDKVLNHMPTFRLEDPWATAEFQVIDLLAQRSGLPPYAGDVQSYLGFNQKEMIDHLHFLKPVTSFRSQFAYQNLLFLVASDILEKKNNMTYPDLLKKDLFTPLGMTSSSATLRDYLASDNRAEGVMHLNDGTIVSVPEDFPGINWNYILGPAGGINSNVKDMSNWLILQANQGKFQGKQIISTKNMNTMTRAMIYIGEAQETYPLYYALGWIRMDYSPYPIIWHNGSTLGVYNFLGFIPQEKLGIVILSNGRNTQLAAALALQFFDMYFEKADQNWSQKLLAKAKEQSKPKPDSIDDSLPPMPLTNYTGMYHNLIYGDANVREENGSLVLVIGKNKTALNLKHWDRDIFTLTWLPFEVEPLKVFFSLDEHGKVAKMQIDLLTKEGSGDFEKLPDQQQRPQK